MNKLKNKIWLYLVFFLIIILACLWIFQVILLDSYYEWKVKSKLDEIGSIIDSTDSNLKTTLDELAYDNDICIEITDTNKSIIYSSNYFYRGCLEEGNKSYSFYKDHFINNNYSNKTYLLRNVKSNTKTLIKAIKRNDFYIFINASLEPIGATSSIITSQLRYVSVIVLILSLFVAYLLSNKISKPMVKLNKGVKEFSKGNYKADFGYTGNIEEIKELSMTLSNAAKELEKTETLRREFLANVGHDLKTPLTMIKAYAEMVRDVSYKDDKKRTDNLNVIIEETDRLNILVNDILDLSKLQANTVKLEYEEFDLDSLIKSIIKRFDIFISKEGYTITYNGVDNAIVNADKKRVEQVLYNLINNAIQYTGDNKLVMVRLSIKDNSYLIEVEDTGKGIDKEELNNIWDKYYKIDKSHKRDTVGSGIGLSIVKSVCINHKFNYGVNSIKKKGSTFWIEIPKV